MTHLKSFCWVLTATPRNDWETGSTTTWIQNRNAIEPAASGRVLQLTLGKYSNVELLVEKEKKVKEYNQ